ncbi:MAG TPA: S8 family serine peptidase [Nakamurella sp.]
MLDTGIDRRHPALTVTHSVETCGESVDVPGGHGTHCAGIIASTDPTAPGIAPGVDLIDVKVLRANGTGRHTAITAGVDRALDLSADILSISLGFNHLPVTVAGGHGWTCVDGGCPLCTAVDNAVLEGALVVVAAGNEHQRCERARAAGDGLAYDTELTCPGQARGALTVGAVHQATHAPAVFSSKGPTAYDVAKPDLVAPGVDVRSTIPLRRDATGRAVPGPPPLLFGVRSGTSTAAPAVAAACALLVESARRTGAPDDPGSIRRRLLDTCVERIGGPANVVGAGRLRLSWPGTSLRRAQVRSRSNRLSASCARRCAISARRTSRRATSTARRASVNSCSRSCTRSTLDCSSSVAKIMFSSASSTARRASASATSRAAADSFSACT